MSENFDKIFEDFEEEMRNIRKYHEQMDNEFIKLATEPCSKVPEVNSHVLIAVGLLNMGHLWIREEAVVLKCADTSFYVEFLNKVDYSTKKPKRMWVHQALITDVL